MTDGELMDELRQEQALLSACLSVRNGAGGRLSAIGCFKREADILPMNVEGSIDPFLTLRASAFERLAYPARAANEAVVSLRFSRLP